MITHNSDKKGCHGKDSIYKRQFSGKRVKGTVACDKGTRASTRGGPGLQRPDAPPSQSSASRISLFWMRPPKVWDNVRLVVS